MYCNPFMNHQVKHHGIWTTRLHIFFNPCRINIRKNINVEILASKKNWIMSIHVNPGLLLAFVKRWALAALGSGRLDCVCHILSIGRSFFCSKQIIFFQKIGTCSDISDHFWLKSSGITKCSVQTVLNHTSHEILKGAARRNRRTRRTAIVAGLPSPCGSSWSPAPRDGFLKVLGLGDDKRNKCICYMLFYSNICAHIRSYHAIPYTCVYIYYSV